MAFSVDLDSYERWLSDRTADLVSRLWARKPKPRDQILERLRLILGDVPAPRGDLVAWASDIKKRLLTLYRGGSIPLDQRSAFMSVLGDVSDLEEDKAAVEASLRDGTQKKLKEAEAISAEVLAEVQKAAGRVPRWGGTPVVVEATRPSQDSETDLPGAFHVYVGAKAGGQSFTVFWGGRVEGVEDILEGGDADFFSSPTEAADYFNLVKELQKPGSSARGRFLSLWTARPVRDRAKYESAQTLPPNIFLTSRQDRAEGLALDGELGGGDRDVYRVVINEVYLVQTLDSGSAQDYQVVGDRPAPVKSMELYSEASPRRVAAQWKIRNRPL